MTEIFCSHCMMEAAHFKPFIHIEAHTNTILEIEYSADGRRVASAWGKNPGKIWDAKPFFLRRLTTVARKPPAHAQARHLGERHCLALIRHQPPVRHGR